VMGALGGKGEVGQGVGRQGAWISMLSAGCSTRYLPVYLLDH
jgi:hypothetical protein